MSDRSSNQDMPTWLFKTVRAYVAEVRARYASKVGAMSRAEYAVVALADEIDLLRERRHC